jgi:peptidase E
MAAARQMLRARGDSVLVGPEQRHAIAQLRALDRHHLQRIQSLHGEFDAAFASDRQPVLETHRAEIADRLAGTDTVIITGGNVAVLINRLRLFDVGTLLANKHVVAWSAGAMALTDSIVLYHDNAPEGRRNPELFGPGLGLVPRHVLLPDARHRLRRNDRIRLALFGRRFAPAACITLDNENVLRVDDGVTTSADGCRRIGGNGRLRRVKAA